MKRYTVIFFILSLLFTVTCKAEFRGFYLGQSFGGALNKGNFSSASSSVAVFGLPYSLTLSSQSKHDDESFWGEIYGGYGYTFFSYLYLGIRVGANLSDFNVKSRSLSSLSQTVSQTIPISSAIMNNPRAKLWFPEVTFDQKVGWNFYEKTLVFALVGFALNRPHLKGSVKASDSAGGETPFNREVNFPINKRGKLIHFRWGLGLEYQFLCNWGMQFLYTQTNYGKLHFKGFGTDFDIPSVKLTASTCVKAKLRKAVYSVGFVHYF